MLGVRLIVEWWTHRILPVLRRLQPLALLLPLVIGQELGGRVGLALAGNDIEVENALAILLNRTISQRVANTYNSVADQ